MFLSLLYGCIDQPPALPELQQWAHTAIQQVHTTRLSLKQVHTDSLEIASFLSPCLTVRSYHNQCWSFPHQPHQVPILHPLPPKGRCRPARSPFYCPAPPLSYA